jgi:hypothetical protein
MLKILYFASVRELLGRGERGTCRCRPAVADIAGLIGFLAARGGAWESLAARSGICATRSIRKWRG